MGKLFDVVRKTEIVELPPAASVVPAAPVPPAPAEPVLPERPANANPLHAVSRVLPLRIPEFLEQTPSDSTESIAAEQYRLIRTKLMHHHKQPRLVVVSSASSGDGKTMTSINLAASLAFNREGAVLLIDTDLRRPTVSDTLGVPKGPGLADVLAGKIDLASALIRSRQADNFYVLTAGEDVRNPAELLSSANWKALVETARQQFQYVIFDATPMAAVADYELVQVVSDAVILVIRPGHTDRKAYVAALQQETASKLLGIVMNGVEDWWLWKTPTYGYYRPKQVVGPNS